MLISKSRLLEGLFSLLMREYLKKRYKIDEGKFIKAEEKARNGNTEDLQNQIGKHL